MLFTPGKLPKQHAQVLDHDLKALGSNPALRLLINDRPRRQIMRHHPPLHSGAHHISQPVEHFPQTVLPLCRIFAAKRQVRCHERPFLITNVTRIATSARHDSILSEVDAASSTIQHNWNKLNNRL